MTKSVLYIVREKQLQCSHNNKLLLLLIQHKYYLTLAVNTTQIENENDLSEKSRRQKKASKKIESKN